MANAPHGDRDGLGGASVCWRGPPGLSGPLAQAGNSRGRPRVSGRRRNREPDRRAGFKEKKATGQGARTMFNELAPAAGPRARLTAFTVTLPGTHSSDGGSRLPRVLWGRPGRPVPRRAHRPRVWPGSEVGTEPLQLPRVRVTEEQQLPLALLRARCRESKADGCRFAPHPAPPAGPGAEAPRPGPCSLRSARQPGASALTRSPDKPLCFLRVTPSTRLSLCPRSIFCLGDSVRPPSPAETAPSASQPPALWSRMALPHPTAAAPPYLVRARPPPPPGSAWVLGCPRVCPLRTR